ncbi:hypothetical protein BDV18DRAFT_148263 [Aspergillus unguis]
MDLDNTPGMQPPAGHVPQFTAPYNSLQIGTIIAFAVVYFLATVCVGLRYFQAFKLIQKIEIDLVIITISYGLAVTYFVTMLELFKHGWGRHLWDVSLAQLIQLNQALLPNTLCYLICPAVTKLAILSVLYRINPSIPYRCAVGAVAAMIFGYTLTLCIITGGPCSPLKDGTLTCLENVALSGAVLNIASDLAVIALPIPTIHNLQLSMKQKVTVGCLLALGSSVIVCSIARLPYVIRLSGNGDSTYTQAILGVWSIIEVNLGIICACAMRFKRLIATYLPRLSIFSSRSRSKSRSKGLARGTEEESGTNRARDGYRLHSVQVGKGSKKGKTGISVYREFDVDVSRREQGDTGSTDMILS